MLIYLIRHGQSEGNVKSDETGVIHGRNDPSHLTELGRQQITTIAEKIRENMPEKKFVLWHSPTERTQQSARIVESIIPISETHESAALYDIHFGDFEHHTWQYAMSHYPEWIKKFHEDRYTVSFPNGESIRDLHERLKTFLHEKLFAESDKNHILVTHEEVIRAFLSICHKFNGFYHDRKIKIPNASLSIMFIDHNNNIVIQAGRDDAPEKFDTSHLLTAYHWFIKTQPFPYEFLPKKNFSENAVFAVRTDSGRETVKLVPVQFEKDLKKDTLLTQTVEGYTIPVPAFLQENRIDEHIFVRRSYLPGQVADVWIKTEHNMQTSQIMGQTLKKIHELPYKKFDKKVLETLYVYPYYEKPLHVETENDWKNAFLKPWIEQDLKTLQKIKFHEYKKIEKLLLQFLENLKVKKITLLHNDFSLFNVAMMKHGDSIRLSGVWDFERSFVGDNLWDLGQVQKIGFLKYQTEFEALLSAYFEREVSFEERQTINFYTLLNCTGAIHYRDEKGLDTAEEEGILNFLLTTFQLD